jgi:phosphotransferase system HPr-like phosphotransfer protein
MGKLLEMTWDKTTVVDLVEDAESSAGNQFDLIELGMNNGRTIAVAVLSGPHTEAICQAMRKLNQEDM